MSFIFPTISCRINLLFRHAIRTFEIPNNLKLKNMTKILGSTISAHHSGEKKKKTLINKPHQSKVVVHTQQEGQE
jgi:hypothetical protein